jgi:hypothetical protein
MTQLKKTPHQLLDQLDNFERQHTLAALELQRFLESRGWKHTCESPLSIWLFEKKLPDGRTLLTDRHTAEAIERRAIEDEIEF